MNIPESPELSRILRQGLYQILDAAPGVKRSFFNTVLKAMAVFPALAPENLIVLASKEKQFPVNLRLVKLDLTNEDYDSFLLFDDASDVGFARYKLEHEEYSSNDLNDEREILENWVLRMTELFSGFVTGFNGKIPPVLTGVGYRVDSTLVTNIEKNNRKTELVIVKKPNGASSVKPPLQTVIFEAIKVTLLELLNNNDGLDDLSDSAKNELACIITAVFLMSQDLETPVYDLYPSTFFETHSAQEDVLEYLGLVQSILLIMLPETEEQEEQKSEEDEIVSADSYVLSFAGEDSVPENTQAKVDENGFEECEPEDDFDSDSFV